jgi:ATP-dependent RNA helicase DDX24/MAK5
LTSETLANDIKGLKFLVLDEADRMIEAGHFAELDNILRLTLRDSRYVRKPSSHYPIIFLDAFFADDGLARDDNDNSDVNEAGLQPDHINKVAQDPRKAPADELQTFIFSATLSKDLQRNVKRGSQPKKSSGNKKRGKTSTTLGNSSVFQKEFKKLTSDLLRRPCPPG